MFKKTNILLPFLFLILSCNKLYAPCLYNFTQEEKLAANAYAEQYPEQMADFLAGIMVHSLIDPFALALPSITLDDPLACCQMLETALSDARNAACKGTYRALVRAALAGSIASSKTPYSIALPTDHPVAKIYQMITVRTAGTMITRLGFSSLGKIQLPLLDTIGPKVKALIDENIVTIITEEHALCQQNLRRNQWMVELLANELLAKKVLTLEQAKGAIRARLKPDDHDPFPEKYLVDITTDDPTDSFRSAASNTTAHSHLKKQLAAHEAAHVIAILYSGCSTKNFELVTLEETTSPDGSTTEGYVVPIIKVLDKEMDEDLLGLIRIYLAGTIGEQLFVKDRNPDLVSSGARADLLEAKKIAVLFVKCGFSLLGNIFADLPTGQEGVTETELEELKEARLREKEFEITEECIRIIAEQSLRCQATLSLHRPELLALAEALLEKNTMTEAEVKAILAPYDPYAY